MIDSSGRILGLMPHPEAAIRWTQSPDWTIDRKRAFEDDTGDGMPFFHSAYQAAEERAGVEW
jgi:phosphoribosylformylglycinamidine (FGAM) synthase-like amidotransferase family enzyme